MTPETLLWDIPERAWRSVRLICDEMDLSFMEKEKISACIFQESEFFVRAIGKPNADGTRDFGICQYNNGKIRGVPMWIGPGAAFRDEDEVLSDPEKGVRLMIRVYRLGHLNWWVSYDSGAYLKHLEPGSRMRQLQARSNALLHP